MSIIKDKLTEEFDQALARKAHIAMKIADFLEMNGSDAYRAGRADFHIESQHRLPLTDLMLDYKIACTNYEIAFKALQKAL